MNKNSLAAYRSIGAHLDSHYFAIYEALLSGGPQNAWDIASVTPRNDDWLLPDQVFRRLSELERAGWIERMDWTAPSPSGCQCSVWWINTKETK